MFLSSTKSWDTLVQEASDFATNIGRERLINVSVSSAGGTDLFGRRTGRDLRVGWTGTSERFQSRERLTRTRGRERNRKVRGASVCWCMVGR
jgi:hypothetical protein